MKITTSGNTFDRIQNHFTLLGQRECHIESDWLLIYKTDVDCIVFERIGTHLDLFMK